MKFRNVILLVLASLMVSCAEISVIPDIPFQLSEREYLYRQDEWSFTGRLALANGRESFSASINWKHHVNLDEIELTGPFGQGRTLFTLSERMMTVDDGKQRLKYFGNLDELVSMHAGITVPVLALKYWVLGLVEPTLEYQSIENGFMQSGWDVSFMQMQAVDQHKLPRKLTVVKGKSKLKLIINQWYLGSWK